MYNKFAMSECRPGHCLGLYSVLPLTKRIGSNFIIFVSDRLYNNPFLHTYKSVRITNFLREMPGDGKNCIFGKNGLLRLEFLS